MCNAHWLISLSSIGQKRIASKRLGTQALKLTSNTTGASCLKTTLKNNIHCCNCTPRWGSNLRLSDFKSGALPLSYTATGFLAQKILRLFTIHLAHKYREKTTTSCIFMPCKFSSCRVKLGRSNRPATRKNLYILFIRLDDMKNFICWKL